MPLFLLDWILFRLKVSRFDFASGFQLLKHFLSMKYRIMYKVLSLMGEVPTYLKKTIQPRGDSRVSLG